MNSILDILEKKRVSIVSEIDDIDYIFLQINILEEIISILNNDYYENVKSNLSFLNEKLALVFPLKKANEYADIIDLTLSILIKYRNNHKIDEECILKTKKSYESVKELLEKELIVLKNKVIENKKNELSQLHGDIDKLLLILKTKSKCSISFLKKSFDIMIELGISKKDVVLITEEIMANDNDKKRTFDISDILKSNILVLTIGEFEHEDKSKIKALYISFVTRYNDKKDNAIFDDLLKMTKDNSNVISDCVLRQLLNYIKYEIDNLKDCLMEKDFYFDEESLTEIIQCYQQYVSDYKKIDSIRKQIKTEEIKKENNKILFLTSGTKSYFEKDIKSMNEEYLEPSLELLNSLVNNDPLIVKKSLCFFEDNVKKCKYDKLNNKVRILYYPIDGNDIVVLGVFIKDSFNSNTFYKRIGSRYRLINDNNVVNLDSVYDNIEDYVLKNGRKGTRR